MINKKKITSKVYRYRVNEFIHFVRIYRRVFFKKLNLRCPFHYTSNGKRII